MPRNGSGTYTLPTGNPVVTGTTIESNWANTTLSDVATELTGSLARSGAGGMTGALRLADGSQAVPSLAFGNETGTGLYRAGTGEMWATVQGAQTLNLDATGVYVPADKTTTVDGAFVFNEAGADKDARFEGDTDANLLCTDASADAVGVGTNTPGAKLNISKSSNGATVEMLRLDNGGSGANTAAQVSFRAAATTYATITGGYGASAPLLNANVATGGAHTWAINSSDQMTLNSTGLGIGTSSPSQRLAVINNTTYQVRAATATGNYTSGGMVFGGFGADASDPNFYGAVGYDHSTGKTYLRNKEFNAAGGIVFETATTGGFSERARITGAGDFLVGTTSQFTINTFNGTYSVSGSVNNQWLAALKNTQAGALGIAVNYSAASPNGTGNQFLYCSDSSALRAEIRSNGGLANYSANNVNLSDVRTKTDIQPATSYLDKICAIPVKTFLYKDQTDTERNLGVIAQDVDAVAPELIDHSGFGEAPEGESPYLAVYQTDLQYALMKCIQEQQALITALTARIEALEAK